jgi:Rha family phage regulatory protein
MADLVPIVNNDGTVSSKLVAEKFGKRHKNVLRDLHRLEKELSNDFYRLNFEPLENTGEILMTRNGFSILAMGFTGKPALVWKERFLEAFNQMEQTLLAEIPQLKDENARLKSRILALPPPKKPHHLTGTVPAMECQDALWEGEKVTRIVRVKKDDPRYSQKSRDEGKIAQFSACIAGMSNAILEITRKDSIERRK